MVLVTLVRVTAGPMSDVQILECKNINNAKTTRDALFDQNVKVGIVFQGTHWIVFGDNQFGMVSRGETPNFEAELLLYALSSRRVTLFGTFVFWFICDLKFFARGWVKHNDAIKNPFGEFLTPVPRDETCVTMIVLTGNHVDSSISEFTKQECSDEVERAGMFPILECNDCWTCLVKMHEPGYIVMRNDAAQSLMRTLTDHSRTLAGVVAFKFYNEYRAQARTWFGAYSAPNSVEDYEQGNKRQCT